jgi:hypothetical protein
MSGQLIDFAERKLTAQLILRVRAAAAEERVAELSFALGRIDGGLLLAALIRFSESCAQIRDQLLRAAS